MLNLTELEGEAAMTTAVFSKNVLEGGWVSNAYADTTSGLLHLKDTPPDRIVIDLNSVDDGCLRAVRQAFSGPIVVVGKGKVASDAINGGANDYAETFEEVPPILANVSRRHVNRECAANLCKQLTTALAAIPVLGASL